MEGKITIALIGAGMFGGDVHARAYADLQSTGISGMMGRVGLDPWARDLAGIEFDLVAALLGGNTAVLSKFVYCLVGLAAIYQAASLRSIQRRWHVQASPA